jgi:hypothetical protein
MIRAAWESSPDSAFSGRAQGIWDSAPVSVQDDLVNAQNLKWRATAMFLAPVFLHPRGCPSNARRQGHVKSQTQTKALG